MRQINGPFALVVMRCIQSNLVCPCKCFFLLFSARDTFCFLLAEFLSFFSLYSLKGNSVHEEMHHKSLQWQINEGKTILECNSRRHSIWLSGRPNGQWRSVHNRKRSLGQEKLTFVQLTKSNGCPLTRWPAKSKKSFLCESQSASMTPTVDLSSSSGSIASGEEKYLLRLRHSEHQRKINHFSLRRISIKSLKEVHHAPIRWI